MVRIYRGLLKSQCTKGVLRIIIQQYNMLFKAIASTLSIVSEQGKEGIKIDGSFHQHHAQIYSGGYGMSLTDDVSKFMEMSVDTQFANEFTLEKKENISETTFRGTSFYLVSETLSIFGTRGRNISRPTSEYTTVPVDVLERAVVGDPANARDL